MLDEAPDAARRREARLVEEMAASPRAPIVLFGAGGLGHRTLSLLRSHGRDVAAFVDNNPALLGRDIDGVPVLSHEDARSRYASEGFAIVTIWRAEGGHNFLVTRAELREKGWRRVESFIPLFWAYGADALPYITIDLPTKVLAARDAVIASAGLWADERSLREYVAQVEWRLTGDFSVLQPAQPHQYFADGIVSVGPDEVFVDCGAFTGDTLLDVARRVPSWRAYHAFEPDPVSFEALQASVATLPVVFAERVHLHQAATADRAYTARFDATGLGSASLGSAGSFEVECVAVDDVITDAAPTFIKMDIEGAESDALIGCQRSIRESRPLLAVAAYHKQADLWELAGQVQDLTPESRLFLRPHVPEGFDTILYAVPPDRPLGA